MEYLKYLFCIALSLSVIPFNSANCSALIIDDVAVAQNTDCPLCLKALVNTIVTKFPCNHGFHSECLKNSYEIYKPHPLLWGTRMCCKVCEGPIPEEVIKTHTREITESDIWQLLAEEIEVKKDSLNGLKSVIQSFLSNEESTAELEAIFSLNEEEARTTREDLLKFFQDLRIDKLLRNHEYWIINLKGERHRIENDLNRANKIIKYKTDLHRIKEVTEEELNRINKLEEDLGRVNERLNNPYITRLRKMPIFCIIEEAAKLLLATNAQAIRQRLEYHEQLTSLALRFVGINMHALVLLANYYETNPPVDEANPLFARIRNIDPSDTAWNALATAHTGARQEDLRNLINNAEQDTDTWMLSKFYLFTQVWNVMPSSTQQFFRDHPCLKMGGLWLLSSAKVAVVCAISALLVDLVIRAKVGKIDQKRQKEYEDSLLDRDEDQIEEIKPPRQLTPYFSWPIRAYALIWTLAALRVWRAHHLRHL